MGTSVTSIPASAKASSSASATATFAAWCRPRRPTRTSPSRASSTVRPSRSQPISGAGRTSAVGFGLGNAGYVTLGASGSTRFDDLWTLDPAADVD